MGHRQEVEQGDQEDIEEQLHEGILRLKQQAVDAGQELNKQSNLIKQISKQEHVVDDDLEEENKAMDDTLEDSRGCCAVCLDGIVLLLNIIVLLMILHQLGTKYKII